METTREKIRNNLPVEMTDEKQREIFKNFEFLQKNFVQFTGFRTWKNNGKWVPMGDIMTSHKISLIGLINLFKYPLVVRDFGEPKSWQKGKRSENLQPGAFNLTIPCDIDEYRSIENILCCTALMFDFEKSKVFSFNIIKEKLNALGYFWIGYSTYSNYKISPDEKGGRFRIIVPLKKYINPKVYFYACSNFLLDAGIAETTDNTLDMKDKGIDLSMFSPEHTSYMPVTACEEYYFCEVSESEKLYRFPEEMERVFLEKIYKYNN